MSGFKRRIAAVLIVVLIIAGFVAAVAVSDWNARSTAESQAQTILTDTASEQARSLGQTFDGQFQVLETLSTSIGQMETPDDTSIASLLGKTQDSMNAGMLCFIGTDGVSRVGANAGTDTSGSVQTQEALAGQRGMAYTTDLSNDRKGIAMSVPCYHDGELIGIVSGMYYEDDLAQDLTASAYAGRSMAFITDSSGQIILPSSNSLFVDIDNNSFSFFSSSGVSISKGYSIDSFKASLAADEEAVLRFSYGGSERIVVYEPVNDDRLPTNDFFVANEVDESAYAEDMAKTRMTSAHSMLVLAAFLLAALSLFMYYDRSARKAQLADANRIRERDSQYAIVLEQSGKHVYQYDIKTGDGTHLSEENPFGTEPVREDMVETMIGEGHVWPSQEDAFRAFFKRIRSGESPLSVRFKLSTRDGGWTWFQEDSTTVFDHDGSPTYAIISYWDITEQRSAEARYDRSVSYRELAEKNTLASFHLDATSNLVDDGISEKDEFQALGDVGTLDALIDATERHIPDDDLCTEFHSLFSRNALKAAFGEGRTQVVLDHPFSFEAGGVRWTRTTVNLFSNPQNGDIEGFIYSTDIEDEHQYKLLLRTVVDNDYDFVLILNREDGTYRTFVSKADENLFFGGSGDYDDSVRTTAYGSVLPEDRQAFLTSLELGAIRERLDAEGPFGLSTRLNLDGDVRNKYYHLSYLEQDPRYVVLSRTDVTASTVRLQDALDKAKQASEAKGEFLSSMSHDIRTPMNAIVNLTHMMRDEVDDKDALLADLDRVESSNEFLLSLINDVLDMSHIESGVFSLTPVIYRAADFTEYIENIVVPLCDRKGVRFSWEGTATGETLYIDKTRFNQVFFNLLSNAVKFTPKGGHVSVSVRDNEVEDGKLSCTFVVSDTGIGMSKGLQEHMFESFAREDKDNAYQGTGLGLAITKAIVDKMDGTISVKSAPGEGTSFFVHLSMPIATPEQIAADKSLHRSDGSSFERALAGKRVLLCEDNHMNALVTDRLLQKVGVTVEEAVNGAVGVDLFRAHEVGYYDAILMDVRMPVMDGIEATRTIRSMDRIDAKTVPIIAMTADAFAEDRERTSAAGMNAHLSKPIVPANLFRTLAEVMGA